MSSKLRCIVRRQGNLFQTECIDLGLRAEGITFAQSYSRLREAIEFDLEEPHKARPSLRGALCRLWWWFRYTFIVDPPGTTLFYHYLEY